LIMSSLAIITSTLNGRDYSPTIGHFYFGILGHYHFGGTCDLQTRLMDGTLRWKMGKRGGLWDIMT